MFQLIGVIDSVTLTISKNVQKKTWSSSLLLDLQYAK